MQGFPFQMIEDSLVKGVIFLNIYFHLSFVSRPYLDFLMTAC